MASGSQTLTTYYAKRIIGDTNANTSANALLQTGTGVTTSTWIFNYTTRADYGIQYVTDNTDANEKLQVHGGSSNITAWVKLKSGDTYIKGNTGIGTDPDSSYVLKINGTTYCADTITTHTDFKCDTTGYGLYLKDNASNEYAGIYDDGTNLWIGAISATGQHHKGNLYFSAGHNGTSGNASIYISIPANGNSTTTDTNYPLVYKDAAGSATNGIYTDANGKTIAMTYSLNATINASANANKLAYYSGTNAISEGTIITNGEYLGSVSYLSVNTAHQTSYRAYINGTMLVQGNSYINVGNNSVDITQSNNAATTNGMTSNTNRVLHWTDANGRYIGRIYARADTNGKCNIFIQAGNWYGSTPAQQAGGIQITLDKSGNCTYSISGAANFRSAISAKAIQTAVSDPSASGSGITYISTISQNTEGVISVTKSTVRDASASQSGVVSTGAQTFAGTKTFSSKITGSISGNCDGSSGSCTGNAATATKLAHTTLDSTTINNTAGSFAFSGSGDPWSGSDWVGLQIGDNADKFQISARSNTLVFRQNDSGGTNTSWSDWVTMVTSANYTSYTVTKTGTGASGTWGIDISGNAATATCATRTGVSVGWHKGRDAVVAKTTTINSYSPTISVKTTNGSWEIGSYNNSSYTDKLIFSYVTDANYNSNTNSHVEFTITTGGYFSGSCASAAACTGNAATATTASACSGNAATATKLATAREIYVALGSTRDTDNKVTFDGSAAKAIHVSGTLAVARGGTGQTSVANIQAGKDGSGNTITSYYCTLSTAQTFTGNKTFNSICYFANGTTYYVNKSGDAVFKTAKGAVWNDYAEYRKTVDNVKPGQVVIDNDDGSLSISIERLQSGAHVVSDTYGFSIGETEKTKTPVAVSGRVLAYTYRPREEYHAGMAVCSAPNGTVDIMTRDEIMMYPERIVGTVSEIPDYEIWHGGSQETPTDIQVDGRIWIYVK